MKFWVFGLALWIPLAGWAGLDETVLYSADKKCAVRYLTPTPKTGWTIETHQNCSNGWVNDYATVHILGPDHQVKEILKGFFLDGYWLDRFPAKGTLQDRTNPQENVQALTYVMNTDEEEVTYLVQLRAERPEKSIYSAFKGCPVFRLLAITKNRDLFQNEAFQEHLAQKALAYAGRLCAELETVAVFGATRPDARANDIVFQMQIDPKTKEKNIIPLSMDFQNSDINEPLELRRESGTVLLAVTADPEQQKIEYNPPAPPSVQTVSPPKKTMPLTSLMHLNAQSRLTDQPAQGRIIVHINDILLDGSAQVDLPEPVLLKYHPRLKIGWAIIRGYFYKNQIQVNEITFCQQEWCADVS